MMCCVPPDRYFPTASITVTYDSTRLNPASSARVVGDDGHPNHNLTLALVDSLGSLGGANSNNLAGISSVQADSSTNVVIVLQSAPGEFFSGVMPSANTGLQGVLSALGRLRSYTTTTSTILTTSTLVSTSSSLPPESASWTPADSIVVGAGAGVAATVVAIVAIVVIVVVVRRKKGRRVVHQQQITVVAKRPTNHRASFWKN